MRTAEEIRNDYGQAAASLGDVEYRISVFQEDARKIRRKMRQLNIEAAQLQNTEHNKALEAADGQQADSSTETA